MRRLALAALASFAAAAALANGTATPDTVAFFADADAPGDLAMNTTFGFLFTEDAGATWAWTCHEAVIGNAPFTPGAWRAPDGAFYVTTPLALGVDPTVTLYRTTDRGCEWTPVASLASETVRALAFRPGDDATVLAVGSRPGGVAAAWRSTDGGVTFGEALLEVPEHVFTTVLYAPSDPQRIYVGALKQSVPQDSAIYRSDDGGDSWTALDFPWVDQPPIRVLAVDPLDPDVLWVRNDAAADRVFRSTDGGVAFSLAHSLDRDIAGFALTDGGATRWIAVTQTSGLLRATAAAPAFVSLPGSPIARCVEAEGGQVYACAHPYADPYAAAGTTDGVVYDSAMTFQRIEGPLPCAAGSDHTALCEPLWPAVRQNLGLDSPTPTPTPPAGADAEGGGCACSLPSGATGGNGVAGPLAAALIAGLRVFSRFSWPARRSFRVETREGNHSETRAPRP